MDLCSLKKNVHSALGSSSGASVIWKGIREGLAEIISKGCRWSVRNGLSTLIWKDTWICGEPLINFAISDVNDTLLDLCVRDFWCEDVDWNGNQLSGLLPPSHLLQIALVMIFEGDDDISYKFSSD